MSIIEPIVILSAIGFGCGLAIHFVNRYLPKESEDSKKAQEISEILPGTNCGACGFGGCFAYAIAIANDENTVFTNPCIMLMKDEVALTKLETLLDFEISNMKTRKAAIIHCRGNSDIIFDYSGIKTCRAAAQLIGGYKRCPFGCIGLGDCLNVCPENAIVIDKDKNIALIDEKRCNGCGLCVSECPMDIIEIVPADLPRYLACNYTAKKNIVWRERCDVGCIHCKICLKVDGEALVWDEKRDLPRFVEKSRPAVESIKKCPRNIILPLAIDSETEEKI